MLLGGQAANVFGHGGMIQQSLAFCPTLRYRAQLELIGPGFKGHGETLDVFLSGADLVDDSPALSGMNNKVSRHRRMIVAALGFGPRHVAAHPGHVLGVT